MIVKLDGKKYEIENHGIIVGESYDGYYWTYIYKPIENEGKLRPEKIIATWKYKTKKEREKKANELKKAFGIPKAKEE